MTVENLEINVKTNVSGSSAQTIKTLADALGQLQAKAAALSGLSNLSNILNAISGVTVKASSLNGLAKGIENLHNSLSVITSDEVARLSELAVVLKSLIGVNPGGFSGMTKAANSFRELGAASGAASGVARNMRQTASGINSVSRAAQKSQSPLSNFVSSLKRIAFYRMIRTIIKEITQAFSEGLKNAYLFSAGLETVSGRRFAKAMDDMNSAATQMKAQLGSAFIGLLTAIEPILTRLIDLVTRAADVVSQFFAAFTGGTYLRAAEVTDTLVDDFQSGAKAAKEWKNQLLGFDVINRLNDSGTTGLSPSELFGGAEAPIDEKYLTLADKIRGALGELDFSPYTTALERIKGLLDSIGRSFKEAFSDGRGAELLSTIWSILSNIVTTVGNIADSFRRAWDENDRGTTLLRNILSIVQTILDCVDRITESVGNWADTLDFGPIIDSFIRLTEAIQPLVDLITDALAWAVENILEPLGKWVIEEAGPASVDLLTEAIRLLTDVLTPLWEGFKKAWDHIKPIVEWFGTLIVDILHLVAGEIRKFADMVEENSDGISGNIEELGAIVGEVWDEVKPLLEAIKSTVFGTVKFIFAAVRLLFRWVSVILGGLSDALVAFGEGDWAGAWEALKGVVIGVWESLKLELPNLLDGLTDLIVGFIEGLNAVLGWFGIDPIPLPGSASSKLRSYNYLNSGQSDGRNVLLDYVNELTSTGNVFSDYVSGNLQGYNGVQAYNGVSDATVNAAVASLADKLEDEIQTDTANIFSDYASGKFGGVAAVPVWPYATGGLPDMGSLFIANESGPELVGSIGGRTAVANNDQIVEAVSSGVYQAVSSAMGNGNRDISVRVYLDSREIKAGQQRLARATGR